MPSVQEYAQIALDACALPHVGALYGDLREENTFGTGVFCEDVVYSIYDDAQSAFGVFQGLAYILTHECDIDAANKREFSDQAVVCPVTPLGAFVTNMQSRGAEPSLRNLLPAIGANSLSRVFYLPPHSRIPDGGLLYLNGLCSTHVSLLRASTPLFMLSEYGLQHLDAKLQNHFMREKADPMPRTL